MQKRRVEGSMPEIVYPAEGDQSLYQLSNDRFKISVMGSENGACSPTECGIKKVKKRCV